MSEQIRIIESADFEREVLAAEQPVVVDFFSTECPPCEALASKFEALAAIYGDDVKFIKIFRQGNRELAEQLGVRSSPTLLFYQRGARLGDQLTGGIKRAAIERNLDALLAPVRAQQLRARATPSETTCDVLILGAGPAGLTAGIYAAQAKLDTVVIDRGLAGGNLAITHRVSNFPGFAEPQPGYALAHAMGEQARAAGVKFRQAVDVTQVDLAGRSVIVDGIETIRAKKLVLATGSSPRPLGVSGEIEYRGRGISYCATCDAKYYEGKHVVVIGGGNTAIGESLFIARFASHISVVHQFDQLQANREFQDQARANPKFEFLYSHEPREFAASNGSVDAVVVEDLKTGQHRRIACDGVFVFAGMQPNLDGIGAACARDRLGYLQADAEMHTSVPDVFAAGDVRSKQYRQMTTAVADGTIAAMVIAHELGA